MSETANKSYYLNKKVILTPAFKFNDELVQKPYFRTILKVGPDFSSTKYYYPFEHQTTFRPQVALPENVTCEQCILQVNKMSRRKFKKLLKQTSLDLCNFRS